MQYEPTPYDLGQTDSEQDNKTVWSVEDRAWQAAYAISWIGASNPRAVEYTLTDYRKALGPDHIAVRAIAGHLDFLRGESLGPEFDELDAVLANARRLGIHTESR